MRRAVVLAALALLLGLGLRRDVLRRRMGLKRRTPQLVMVDFLLRGNSAFSRWLGRYLSRHTTQTYILLVLTLYGIAKYNLKLRQLWRKIKWNRKATKDVLEEYPEEDDPTARSPGPNPRRLSRSRSETHLPASMPAAMTEHMPPDELLRFLEMLQHLIQGVDEDVTASLYQKLRRVQLPKGTVLFHQGQRPGALAVVTRGKLGVYSEVDLTILEEPLPSSSRSTTASTISSTGLRATSSLRDLSATGGDSGVPSPAPLPPTTVGAGSGAGGRLSALSTPRGSDVDAGSVGVEAPGTPLFADGAVATVSSRSAPSTPAHTQPKPLPLLGSGPVPAIGRPLLQFPDDGLAGVRPPSKSSPLLVEFGPAKSIGENVLLAGEHASHPVTVKALEDTEVLVMDQPLFSWFKEQHPHAFVSFVLTTTARQWRVAYVTLVDILALPGARSAAVEPSEPVFPDLTDALSKTIVTAGTGTVVKSAGDSLFNEGDAADCLYVLLEGKATSFSTRDGRSVVTRDLTPGCVVGGLSCFVGLPQRGTVRCLETCVFATFPSRLFKVLMAQLPPAHDHARTSVLMQLTTEIATTLTPLLRMFLHLGLQRLWLQSGDELFAEGDPCTGLYIVISGRLRTIKHHAAPQDPVSPNPLPAEDQPSEAWRVDVSRGETVGEMEVLMKAKTRECDALCVRDCELVFVSRESFARILQRYPTVLKHFTQLLAKRYQEVITRMSTGPSSRPRLKPNYVTVAVVPAGGSPPPLGSFALKLTQALGTMGSVLHINSTKLDHTLGGDISSRMDQPFGRARVTQWINTQEESHRFLVFEADSTVTPWTRVCVEHADCLLLVGLGHTSPALSDVERECVFDTTECRSRPSIRSRGGNLKRRLWDLLDGSKAAKPIPAATCEARSFSRKELVLLHPLPSRRPAGTRQWLRLRRVGWHHHVRTPYAPDFERVARHVAGKARGLVLGGGGARGLAHVGVLRTLESKGIDVDLIGGTSQGAFMAAAYANTLSVDAASECFGYLKRIASPWNLITSLTFPIISYFEGSSFNEIIQDAFGDVQIEDLWIRYFCVTTNVSKARMQVHTVGPLWKYCRASMTILGLLPPMYDNGSLLVDGGYINNLPLDVMQRMAPQMSEVIAVDVERKDNSQFENVDDYGNSLSGWWLLMKLILSKLRLSRPVAIPSVSTVTLSLCYISHTINMRDLLRAGQEDDNIIYIQPPVQSYNLLDYDKREEIEQHGRMEAGRVLAEVAARREERQEAVHSEAGGGGGGGGGAAAGDGRLNSMLSLHRFSILDLHNSATPSDNVLASEIGRRMRAESTPNFAAAGRR